MDVHGISAGTGISYIQKTSAYTPLWVYNPQWSWLNFYYFCSQSVLSEVSGGLYQSVSMLVLDLLIQNVPL